MPTPGFPLTDKYPIRTGGGRPRRGRGGRPRRNERPAKSAADLDAEMEVSSLQYRALVVYSILARIIRLAMLLLLLLPLLPLLLRLLGIVYTFLFVAPGL